MGSKSNQSAKKAEILRKQKGIMPSFNKRLAYPDGYTGLSPKSEERLAKKKLVVK